MDGIQGLFLGLIIGLMVGRAVWILDDIRNEKDKNQHKE